ncbi:MAG: hypothetical protein ACYDAR_01460 [Thermomicrobiales bacterium]
MDSTPGEEVIVVEEQRGHYEKTSRNHALPAIAHAFATETDRAISRSVTRYSPRFTAALTGKRGEESGPLSVKTTENNVPNTDNALVPQARTTEFYLETIIVYMADALLLTTAADCERRADKPPQSPKSYHISRSAVRRIRSFRVSIRRHANGKARGVGGIEIFMD